METQNQKFVIETNLLKYLVNTKTYVSTRSKMSTNVSVTTFITHCHFDELSGIES